MADPHPSLLERKIVHVDMDAFYAAVEIRDRPDLAEKPVIIGGSPQSRGVVAAANYVARKYGVRSAMACARAERLCPGAVFIRPDLEKYRSISGQIRAIMMRYAKMIEPVALDEAYLDVTDSPMRLLAVQTAIKIQQDIRSELGLSCSAGVAPNKLLAKIASDMKKPGGITVVLPADVESFMAPLSLRKINGVGPATEKRLANLGLHICQDVWQRSEVELNSKLGERMGIWLAQRSRGVDPRPVQTERIRKSLGCESTFASDIMAFEALQHELGRLVLELVRRMDKRKVQGRCMTLKVKYLDFSQVTRSRSVSSDEPAISWSDPDRIRNLALQLLGKTAAGQKPIRLIGLSLSNLSGGEGGQ